jgi:hypothetical protein
MAQKAKHKKLPTNLPTGIRSSRQKINPAVAKMLREDRGVASGGSNTVHRAAIGTVR